MRIFSVCLAILLLSTTTVQATYESVENGRTMYDRLGEDRALHLVKEFSPVEKIVTKDQFLNHLYGGIDEPELKIIDVFICKLRKKLEKASGGKNYIETVWGRGYVLRDPDEKKVA